MSIDSDAGDLKTDEIEIETAQVLGRIGFDGRDGAQAACGNIIDRDIQCVMLDIVAAVAKPGIERVAQARRTWFRFKGTLGVFVAVGRNNRSGGDGNWSIAGQHHNKN